MDINTEPTLLPYESFISLITTLHLNVKTLGKKEVLDIPTNHTYDHYILKKNTSDHWTLKTMKPSSAYTRYNNHNRHLDSWHLTSSTWWKTSITFVAPQSLPYLSLNPYSREIIEKNDELLAKMKTLNQNLSAYM